MLTQNYMKWAVSDREWVDNWKYRKYKEYPPADVSESEIRSFIRDAKRSEIMIQKELMADGMDEEEAWKVSCQYPLKDDAPMDAIRSFVAYMRAIQESEKDGVFL